ncbi:DUF1211 domain-containing protein [Pseudoclavibacter chungangensis]|uniref:DUF1211 domain-containing protein n=1 Tax=Pseudoclavibacter chungangensis TaxID=587635 RepID=A0A7J5BPR2_9MICO|nr:TMEM175 family protein [Pseudoclavibacter chungangensis]KAB1655114.1 DUF1211 domain-containing protein [Pseudoclavibacter chungangensis]NYJ66114.1 putative membrane protein [Pseudoclavibacter chungangensis]
MTTGGDASEHRDDDTEAERVREVSLDRLAAFSDAVVAIAITLIALPIVDHAMDAPSAIEFLTEDAGALVAAGLSFLVVALLWRAHHVVFIAAHGYTKRVFQMEVLWLATIVAIPVTTVLSVAEGSNDRLGLGLYVGSMALASILVRIQSMLLERAGLAPRASGPWSERWLGAFLFMIVLVLVVAFPGVGAWWLLVLALEPLLRRIMRALRGGARA